MKIVDGVNLHLIKVQEQPSHPSFYRGTLEEDLSQEGLGGSNASYC